MIVVALDPGDKFTGVIRYDTNTRKILYAREDMPNERVYAEYSLAEQIACEDIVIPGRAGYETFSTARWIGKFQREAEHRNIPFQLVRRDSCANHLYASCPRPMPKTADARVHRALKARFTKEELEGVTGHAWAALAVAVTFADRVI